MHDTALVGGVTSSPLRPSPLAFTSQDDGEDTDSSADERERDDRREAQVGVAALERGNVARGVVGDREQQPDANADDEAPGPAHGATLRLQSGDVDRNGDVVDRFRRAHVDATTAIDLDEHLLGVVRMVAASKALAEAARS
jgi:hypothetical protein